jgi:hypothetical protein
MCRRPFFVEKCKEGLLFVNKKKQKNFYTSGQRLMRFQRHTQPPEGQKFFGSFFQKRTASL